VNGIYFLRRWALAAALVVCGAAGGVAEDVQRGPETNLPLPRYVSMKAAEGFARRGPSQTHAVDWVFRRRDMPLQVTGEYGHWRRVQDIDGEGGWMHFSLLSGVRTVIVVEDYTPLHRLPDAGTPPVAYAERGVIARLGSCQPDWCRITADGYRGWVPKAALWGVDAGEQR